MVNPVPGGGQKVTEITTGVGPSLGLPHTGLVDPNFGWLEEKNESVGGARGSKQEEEEEELPRLDF